MAENWKFLESKNELHILNKFTKNGNTLVLLYRRTLLSACGLFVSFSLGNPLLDILIPLNETRPRQNIFNVNYVILDDQEHFYISYVHLAFSAFVIVLTIISVDSLYITIIYHACGLFAVCGSQVQNTAENNTIEKNGTDISSIGYEQFKQCIIMHYKTLQSVSVI
ncbi:hypothetical protein QLX08_003059 [Tetragonisca angustula]|uniref:Uncharacterized protein n=1 Tax=Tetragonisca angustula TaxID=166442 RepID=A0AAW1A8B4_9HYME